MGKAQIHIIGAGPAGLTAARELAIKGKKTYVYEMSEHVGGISRTEVYKGYHFDIGGHRFYTKVTEIEKLWHEVLGDKLVERPRLSRIYFEGKFYHYPLDFLNTLTNLGLLESALSLFSYIKARLFPRTPEHTFEDWVINRFGERLFDNFFRTYTEKVWGVSVSEIRADWAAQRIKDLSFRSAVYDALFGSMKQEKIKTLITEFTYPTHGPGMMWQYFRDDVVKHDGEVIMQTHINGIIRDGFRVTHLITENAQGVVENVPVDEVISTMPLRQLITMLEPAAPQEVIDAANHLRYRDFLVVCLIINQKELFPDNWIYIHSPEVQVGRIQNFKNWSADMVPDLSKTSLGMEYFCNEGDDLWQMDHDALIKLASKEVEHLGLAQASDVEDGTVLYQRKAYPVYDSVYQDNLNIIQHYLEQFENLQTAGRNGLHRYNNQDHSMLTGLLAARNILNEKHDLWKVNTERSYYETFTVSERETEASLAHIPSD